MRNFPVKRKDQTLKTNFLLLEKGSSPPSPIIISRGWRAERLLLLLLLLRVRIVTLSVFYFSVIFISYFPLSFDFYLLFITCTFSSTLHYLYSLSTLLLFALYLNCFIYQFLYLYCMYFIISPFSNLNFFIKKKLFLIIQWTHCYFHNH